MTAWWRRFFNSRPSLDENRHVDSGWVEESVIFERQDGRQMPLPQSGSFVGTKLTARIARYLFWTVVSVFFLIFTRFFYLQIIKGDDFRSAAEGNRQKMIPIPAERGLIFDAQGVQLTKNIPNFFLALVPQDLPRNQTDRDKIIERLAKLTDQSQEKIRHSIDEYGSYSHESVVIMENIDYETALSVLVQSADLPGIQIQRGSKRSYYDYNSPDAWQPATSTPFSLAHILGYIGKLDQKELADLYQKGYLPSDYVGKTGIEKNYETQLRGKHGKRRVEVDALGREQATLAEEAPAPGEHANLTIDIEIQKKLEELTTRVLKNNHLKRATGIVLNPNTGGVLAMVSLPAFDNNDFSGGISPDIYANYLQNENKPLFNRAAGGLFPSGSTIKPAIAYAALAEGIITSRTTFLSVGGIQVGDWFFPDWSASGHGWTDVRKSLAWSVNTFYYYIGGGYQNFVGLGVDLIDKYLKFFGFGRKLGIDLPGERAGLVPTRSWKEKTTQERWYVGDTYNLSIGQGGLLVTPLQISAFTAVFANNGTLFQPHLLDYFEDPETKTQDFFSPKGLNTSPFTEKYLATVRQGMVDCVEYGSCRLLSDLPFSVAGKTGTAQWNKNKNNHAWFTSFAPVEKPEIVVTILVEEGGEGSRLAAPIAYDFYRWWWNYKSKL
ncbi:MAG: penicillin-binding protein 2 [Candidatus Magasanikbacteria bacterium]|nr:penicillin-binding protein 2 [Candidatus Magasanikbacteria bacterium]